MLTMDIVVLARISPAAADGARVFALVTIPCLFVR